MYDLRWHPSELYCYGTASETQILVWNLDEGNIVHKLEGHEAKIKELSFGESGLISCSFDGTIRIWK